MSIYESYWIMMNFSLPWPPSCKLCTEQQRIGQWSDSGEACLWDSSRRWLSCQQCPASNGHYRIGARSKPQLGAATKLGSDIHQNHTTSYQIKIPPRCNSIVCLSYSMVFLYWYCKIIIHHYNHQIYPNIINIYQHKKNLNLHIWTNLKLR